MHEYESQVLAESVDWITGHTQRKVRTIRNQVIQIILAERGSADVMHLANRMDLHLMKVQDELEQVMILLTQLKAELREER